MTFGNLDSDNLTLVLRSALKNASRALEILWLRFRRSCYYLPISPTRPLYLDACVVAVLTEVG